MLFTETNLMNPRSISLTFTFGFIVFLSMTSIIIARKYSVLLSSLISKCTATIFPTFNLSGIILAKIYILLIN